MTNVERIEAKSARQDLHLHRALIECDRGYKPRCAALHHAPKLAEHGGLAPQPRGGSVGLANRSGSLVRFVLHEMVPTAGFAPALAKV